MRHITSRDNSLLKQLRKLLTSASHRHQEGQTVLDGPHLLRAYLERGMATPGAIVVSQSRLENAEIAGLLEGGAAQEICVVDEDLFRSLSPSQTPSGIVTLIAIPQMGGEDGDACLLLEGVQDPGNLGALLRTARAAGFDDVYLSPGCADPWSPKCLRGGMGAQFGLRLRENVDLASVLGALPGRSVACDPHATQSVFEMDLSGPLSVIVGGEGPGLSERTRAAATQICRIPMQADTESLNVGVAAAIVMYEHVRQHAMRART